MNPDPTLQNLNVKANFQEAVLSDDKNSLIQTFTINLTQSQLLAQLTQSLNQLDSLQNQIMKTNSNIVTLRAQIALFQTPVISETVVNP